MGPAGGLRPVAAKFGEKIAGAESDILTGLRGGDERFGTICRHRSGEYHNLSRLVLEAQRRCGVRGVAIGGRFLFCWCGVLYFGFSQLYMYLSRSTLLSQTAAFDGVSVVPTAPRK